MQLSRLLILEAILYRAAGPYGTKLLFAAVQNYVRFLGYIGREMLAVRLSHLTRRRRSAPIRDEGANLVGRCEDHVGAVAHHPCPDDGGRAFLWAVAADIGFES
jgi:hypothetical protein